MRVVNKFNRGEVSPLALARDDVKKVVDSCELMDNFLPLRLGPMTYRPGIEYIGDAKSPSSSLNRALIPLTRSIGDTVMLEFAGATMRPLVDGLPIPRATGTATMAAGGIAGWTAGGTTSTFGGGQVSLEDDGYFWTASPTITANTPQMYTMTLQRSPILLQIGEGNGQGKNDILEAYLYAGDHLISFTPTTTQFSITITSASHLYGDGLGQSYISASDFGSPVVSGNIEFTVDNIDYRETSHETSGDVIFIARGEDYAPMQVRRIGANGFSVETYQCLRGPYKSINTTDIGVDTTAITGFTTVTADSPLFKEADHTNRLFKISYPDMNEEESFTAAAAGTKTIGVMGVGGDREMLVTITGASSTEVIQLQKYDPKAAAWEKVNEYKTDTSEVVADRADGELVFYRFECTAYSSGTVLARIEYVSPAVHGFGKLLAITGITAGSIDIYSSMIYPASRTTPTVYWWMGAWGPGEYPQGVTIYEGRVVWVSKNRVDMTATDDYWNFDTEIEGSSAAITRTIGFGPVDDIAWVESSNGLFLGLPTTEVLVRSSNYDEPLTPLNTNLKPIKGSVGAKAVRPALSDDAIYFVSRDGKRVHKLTYEIAQSPTVLDQMMMHPTICDDGIAAIVGTQHPEHRLWVLTETGELRVLLKEPTEDVQAWARVTTEGAIEDLCVVPATGEDELWMLVTRNGQTNVEKMAAFSAIEPMDSFVRYASPGTATLTGLDHLEGLDVGIWADGQHRGTDTVASGTVTADSAAYTTVIVGLEYSADYKSNKLGQYVDASVIGERKTVSGTALVMRNYSPGAVQVGRDFNNLLDLPGSQTGAIVTDYDEQAFGFNGTSNTDSRICLRANKPCTIMALSFNIAEKPRSTNG